MVVAVLLIAGDQAPLIPLLEVVGKAARASPEQIGGTAVKVGVTLGSTVIFIVVLLAHCPVLGVNVYVVIPLLVAGAVTEFHEPVMAGASSEDVGKVYAVPPWHKFAGGVKVGVVEGVTVTVAVPETVPVQVFETLTKV